MIRKIRAAVCIIPLCLAGTIFAADEPNIEITVRDAQLYEQWACSAGEYSIGTWHPKKANGAFLYVAIDVKAAESTPEKDFVFHDSEGNPRPVLGCSSVLRELCPGVVRPLALSAEQQKGQTQVLRAYFLCATRQDEKQFDVCFKGGKPVKFKAEPATGNAPPEEPADGASTDAAKAGADDSFILRVTTKTGDTMFAGTDLYLYVLVNGRPDLAFHLDNQDKDDLQRAATDCFDNIQVKYPLSKVTHIQLKVIGCNAWFLEKAEFQFKQGDKTSEVYSFDVNRWFSCEPADQVDPATRALEIKTFGITPEVR